MAQSTRQQNIVHEAGKGYEICAQCESNARHNEAGGYNELAKECRKYCRRGHKAVKRTN